MQIIGNCMVHNSQMGNETSFEGVADATDLAL